SEFIANARQGETVETNGQGGKRLPKAVLTAMSGAAAATAAAPSMVGAGLGVGEGFKNIEVTQIHPAAVFQTIVDDLNLKMSQVDATQILHEVVNNGEVASDGDSDIATNLETNPEVEGTTETEDLTGTETEQTA